MHTSPSGRDTNGSPAGSEPDTAGVQASAPVAPTAVEPTVPAAGPTTAASDDGIDLRQRSVSSGLYMIAREGIGLTLRFGGLLVLTRLLGPDKYGVYAGAAALIVIPTFVAQLATETYLVRMPTEPPKRVYDEAFTVVLISSIVVVGAVLGLTYAVPAILADDRMMDAFRILLISVPINALWAPAQAKLERQYEYRSVALLELSGDVILYAGAIGGVVAGLGYWGPVMAMITWQSWLLLGSMVVARYRPTLRLSKAGARDQVSYGLRYTASVSIQIVRGALNPLFVGHFVGTAGVGAVALATQITEALSAFTRVVWRTGAVTIGRLQNDARRLAHAVREYVVVLVLVMGSAMAMFIIFSPWLVTAVFGDRWEPVVPLLPYLCAASLIWVEGTVGTIVLTTRLKMASVAVSQAVRLLLMAAAAPLLLHFAGLTGFGIAECVSAASTLVLARALRRELPGFGVLFLVPLYAAVMPPLFWNEVEPAVARPLLFLPAAATLTVPAFRARLAGYARLPMEAVSRRRRHAGTDTQPDGHDLSATAEATS